MKMYKKFFVVAAIFVTLFSKEAHPLDSLAGRHNVTIVKLKIGTITELEFPETIANVTKSISGESLQIETLGARMFLLTREMLDSRVYVVTKDNVSYELHLLIDDVEAVTHLRIKKQDNAEDSKQKGKNAVNTIELMKALINDKPFRGVVSSKVPAQEIFNDGKIRIVMDKIYELRGGVKAIVLTFENLSYKPIVVPIEHVELPGLLAISVKSQILEARPRDIKKKTLGYFTKAYMVVEGINR